MIFEGIVVCIDAERSVFVDGNIAINLRFSSSKGVDAKLVAVEVFTDDTFFSDSIEYSTSAAATE